MKITDEIISQYADAIKQANEAAINASTGEDGGTCNFDTPTIDFKGWREEQVKKVAQLSGVDIGEKLTSSYWKGCRFIWVRLDGMAANRTRMAEAANKKLKELNIPCHMYYQMD